MKGWTQNSAVLMGCVSTLSCGRMLSLTQEVASSKPIVDFQKSQIPTPANSVTPQPQGAGDTSADSKALAAPTQTAAPDASAVPELSESPQSTTASEPNPTPVLNVTPEPSVTPQPQPTVSVVDNPPRASWCTRTEVVTQSTMTFEISASDDKGLSRAEYYLN